MSDIIWQYYVYGIRKMFKMMLKMMWMSDKSLICETTLQNERVPSPHVMFHYYYFLTGVYKVCLVIISKKELRHPVNFTLTKCKCATSYTMWCVWNIFLIKSVCMRATTRQVSAVKYYTLMLCHFIWYFAREKMIYLNATVRFKWFGKC